MHGVMKKIGIGLSIFTLLSSTSLAAEKTLHEVKFTIGQAKYQVGDTIKEIDTAPYIKNGRTMLPIRYVGEIIGVLPKDIIWDEMSKTVTIFKGNSIIQMGIGDYTLIKDGQRIVMDTAPEIVNGRTMLPVSYIAKALDIEMKWNSIAKTVTVFTEKDVVESEKEEITWDYQYDQLLEKAFKHSRDLKKAEMELERTEIIKDEAKDEVKSIPRGTGNGKVEGLRNAAYLDYRGAKFKYERAEKQVDQLKDTIAYNVKSAYYAVLKNEDKKAVAKLAMEVANQTMKHTKLKYEQGLVSELEMRQAQRENEEAKKTYEMATKELEKAYEKLNDLVGFDAKERYILQEEIDFEEVSEEDVDLHIQRVIAESPDIWALEQAIQLADLGVKLYPFNSGLHVDPYEAAEIDVKTAEIDLNNAKQKYEQALREMNISLKQLKDQYENLTIKLEKAQDDLEIVKINVEIGNMLPIDMEKATLQLESIKQQLRENIMNYNTTAMAYEKLWVAQK